MKLTIIPSDGAVYKDGLSYSGLDMSFAPVNVHALQFNDNSNAGWIEFVENDFGNKDANEIITSLPAWAITAMTKWDEAKAAQDSAAASAQQAASNQPQTTGTQAA
jgi:hypothetical protein